MKKSDLFLKEYAARLSDDNLKFVIGRLTQRLSGDLPEVINFLSTTVEVDRWFSSAKTCVEFYDMTDTVYRYVDKEYTRRFCSK